MSFNFKRRVLRYQSKEFIKEWKKKNKFTSKMLNGLLFSTFRKVNLNNKISAILDLEIAAQNNKNKESVNG